MIIFFSCQHLTVEPKQHCTEQRNFSWINFNQHSNWHRESRSMLTFGPIRRVRLTLESQLTSATKTFHSIRSSLASKNWKRMNQIESDRILIRFPWIASNRIESNRMNFLFDSIQGNRIESNEKNLYIHRKNAWKKS